jgi:hypothetical protein
VFTSDLSRLVKASGPALVYATGGFAFGEVENFRVTETQTGYVLGVRREGAHVALAPDFSVLSPSNGSDIYYGAGWIEDDVSRKPVNISVDAVSECIADIIGRYLSDFV